jgi:hypothetical protein
MKFEFALNRAIKKSSGNPIPAKKEIARNAIHQCKSKGVSTENINI